MRKTEFVGALIERPRSKMLRIRQNEGKTTAFCHRAIADRPYDHIETISKNPTKV